MDLYKRDRFLLRGKNLLEHLQEGLKENIACPVKKLGLRGIAHRLIVHINNSATTHTYTQPSKKNLYCFGKHQFNCNEQKEKTTRHRSDQDKPPLYDLGKWGKILFFFYDFWRFFASFYPSSYWLEWCACVWLSVLDNICALLCVKQDRNWCFTFLCFFFLFSFLVLLTRLQKGL